MKFRSTGLLLITLPWLVHCTAEGRQYDPAVGDASSSTGGTGGLIGSTGGTNSADGGSGASSGGTAAVGGSDAGLAGGTGSGGAASGGAPSTGGTSSTGGSATGGAAGAGGNPVEPAFVECGGVNCPVHEGGRCCFFPSEDTYTCQLPEAACETTGSGPYTLRFPFACDGTADCPGDMICCYKGNAALPGASVACYTPEDCFDSEVAPRFQVCDPDQTAPSDCLEGTCQPFETIPALSVCEN